MTVSFGEFVKAESAKLCLKVSRYKDEEGLYLCGEYMFTGSYESAMNAGRRAARVVTGELDFV